MPGYSNLRNMLHDSAILAASAETADLRDAKDDAFTHYMNLCATLDEAYNDAYGKAYARLEKKHAT